MEKKRENGQRSHSTYYGPTEKTLQKSIGETPYVLVYDMESVIPLEFGLPAIRSQAFESRMNDLDPAKERRELVAIRLSRYRGELSKQHQKKVRARYCQVGDLVLHKIVGTLWNQLIENSASIRKDPTRSLLDCFCCSP